MTLLEKLAAVRLELQQKSPAKSGKNTFSNYDYYELADFMPAVTELMHKHKLVGLFNMDAENAMLRIVDCEKPDDAEVFTLPVREATLKGAHPIQNLGAMVTYMRRYLWMVAMELVESDGLDAAKPTTKPAQNEEGNPVKSMCDRFDIAIGYLRKEGKYDEATVKKLFVAELGFENYNQMTNEQLPAAKRVLKELRAMAKSDAAKSTQENTP